MKTSRQQILEYIMAQRATTAADLSQALHMTKANARHHLAILKEQGLVEVVGERPSRGKGRPARVFAPSKRSMGENLDLLSSALLLEVNQGQGEGGHLEVMARLAQRLAAAMSVEGSPGSGGAGGSLTQRLYRVVQHLNRHHYQARWEAHSQAPRVILGHCPYAAILEEHPELCQVEAFLLEELLGSEVEQVDKLARDGRGVPYCTFVIVSR
jgi:predicted ArsR family transcriptional regulator